MSDQAFFGCKIIQLMHVSLFAPSSMRDKAKLSVKPGDPASGFSTRKQNADVAFSNLLHMFSISFGKAVYLPTDGTGNVGSIEHEICSNQTVFLVEAVKVQL
jgi:hypothetical protein